MSVTPHHLAAAMGETGSIHTVYHLADEIHYFPYAYGAAASYTVPRKPWGIAVQLWGGQGSGHEGHGAIGGRSNSYPWPSEAEFMFVEEGQRLDFLFGTAASGTHTPGTHPYGFNGGLGASTSDLTEDGHAGGAASTMSLGHVSDPFVRVAAGYGGAGTHGLRVCHRSIFGGTAQSSYMAPMIKRPWEPGLPPPPHPSSDPRDPLPVEEAFGHYTTPTTYDPGNTGHERAGADAGSYISGPTCAGRCYDDQAVGIAGGGGGGGWGGGASGGLAEWCFTAPTQRQFNTAQGMEGRDGGYLGIPPDGYPDMPRVIPNQAYPPYKFGAYPMRDFWINDSSNPMAYHYQNGGAVVFEFHMPPGGNHWHYGRIGMKGAWS